MPSRSPSPGLRQAGTQISGGGPEPICLSTKATTKGSLWTVGLGMKGRHPCHLAGPCKKLAGDAVASELPSGTVTPAKDLIVTM